MSNTLSDDEFVYDRPRDDTTYHSHDQTIDERLESKIEFAKHVGPVLTRFGDHDYTFYHDGEELRCYTDSVLNPGWIYRGDEAEHCLRHQLRMQRHYRSVRAFNHRRLGED